MAKAQDALEKLRLPSSCVLGVMTALLEFDETGTPSFEIDSNGRNMLRIAVEFTLDFTSQQEGSQTAETFTAIDSRLVETDQHRMTIVFTEGTTEIQQALAAEACMHYWCKKIDQRLVGESKPRQAKNSQFGNIGRHHNYYTI